MIGGEAVWPQIGQEKVITMNNLYLTYSSGSADINALENINLDIYEREFICVLGPSGCGKSTLLKILAGFLSPSQGSVTLDGREILSADWHRGVVFQQPALYPWLNVEDNVRFGLTMRNIPKHKAREIVDLYLKKTGLVEFRHHKPYELSGGMKQRIAIARVLANSPRVLLMDEPFGALDALTRENMQNLIRNIWWETQKTIFFITHDVDEALSLGTRVLVMSQRPGRIVKEFYPNFTHMVSGKNSDRTRYSKEFLQMREEVLDLINNQHNDYVL